ncbi:hypothetical protein Bpfe_010454 [Biomphalaria pfeifferi]|uniref:Uncharacterized protein n=1 Tax=Biomphalaria pfeifferi TaxID=112525 RepID=A0AAD8BSX5_BIOPF|nr:hypothetical protein Bpfe_010454 [Biomphalaria pfeifferi]
MFCFSKPRLTTWWTSRKDLICTTPAIKGAGLWDSPAMVHCVSRQINVNASHKDRSPICQWLPSAVVSSCHCQ